MHILVTGAGGLTGSEIVRALLPHGHRITAAVGTSRGRLPVGAERLGELEVLQGDIAGNITLPRRFDAIVHAAARSPLPGVSVGQMVHDNVVATSKLVDHTKRAGAQTFIFFSSLSVYGRITDPVVDEDTPVCDPEAYGLTKRIGEQLLLSEADSFRSLSIRLPGVLGRASTRNWLSGIMASARKGDDICIYNPEAPFNNAVHVADICSFMTKLLENDWHGADVVTVGAAGQISVAETVRCLVREFGGRSRVSIVEQTKSSFVVSSKRAQARYRYDPMDMTQMLRRFAEENRDT